MRQVQPLREVPPPPAPPSPPPKLDAAALRDVFDIGEFFALLRRRKVMIGIVVLCATMAATAAVFMMKPKYTADTMVLLDNRKNTVIDLQAVMSGLNTDAPATVKSEVDVVKSRDLLARVVAKLGLTGDPDFNPALRPKPAWRVWLLSHWNAVMPAWLDIDELTPKPPTRELSAAELQDNTLTTVIDALNDDLVVFNDAGRSYTIHISYTSPDPSMSARVVNAVADEYLNSQLEAKFDATRRANDWLNERVAALKAEVERKENAVQAYRRANNLTQTSQAGTTVTGQQITDVNTQLSLASADRAQKEAALRQFQDAMKRGGADAANAPEVLASPLINTLRAQESELKGKIGEMSSRFGDKHPMLVDARQQLRAVQGQINSEVNKVVGNLANQAEQARIREASLRNDLARLQQSAQQNNQLEVQLRELDREATSSRTMYETFLNRFKETSEQEGYQQADARVIAHAPVPQLPSFPNKKLFIILAFAASLAVGIAIALIIERLDNGFRTGEQVEHLTGIPSIGLLPAVRGAAEAAVLRRPSSSFAEAIRTIRTSIMYHNLDRPVRSILVTSSVPSEGKSALSVSLARAAASSGARVLIVDCDFRRPKLHTIFGFDNNTVLVDLLAGRVRPEDIVHLDQSGANVVGARAIQNPQDVLGSDGMRDFIRNVSAQYDLVILDSPPVMAASDSLILSRIVDATVFVVRWEKTPRQVVLNAIKKLQPVSTAFAGVVISRVNVKRHARFGFGDQGYYYGKYNDYYATK